MKRSSEKEREAAAHPMGVVDLWLERDLSLAAATGTLAPAFEVDDLVAQVADVVESGRWPVLSGDAGIGKTAIVHELIRRVHAGQGPEALGGRRVVQLSLAQRAAGVVKPEHMRPEGRRLLAALLALPECVPFFKDLHLAYQYDLEPHLLSLAMRFPGPVLAEGDRLKLAAMFESSAELAERYVLVPIPEPSIERCERLLLSWAEAQAAAGAPAFSPQAVREALYLSHRFLARTRLPRKAIDLLKQVGSLAGSSTVEPSEVIDRFCRAQAVPRVLIDPALRLDPEEVEARFGREMLGQAEAVAAVVRMICLIKSGLSDARRSFGVFLFVGPTGVGKTHLAQLVAEFLFGSRERMVRFNMADHQQESDVLTLFGNPDGYTLAQRRGTLTARLTGHPFTVLLLDELEKAHPRVHDRFLQLVDEGAFINGAGEMISCRSCIVIATSNAGAELYRGKTLGFLSPADLLELDHEVERQLLRVFRFEFLNRFDQIVHFRPLSREDIRTIASRELLALGLRAGFQRRGIELTVDDLVLDWLAVNGYDAFYGARILRRTIERHVSVALAEALMRAPAGDGQPLELTVRRNRVVVRPAGEAEAPAAAAIAAAPEGASAPRDIRAQAETLLASYANRVALLEGQRQERSRLLERLNRENGWQDPRLAEEMQRYRELDVAIRTQERLFGPLVDLQKRLADARAGGETLRPLLLSAEAALRDWEDRLEEGTSAEGVWMVISAAEVLRPAAEWIRDLVDMEQEWCRRLQLGVHVAAYEPAEAGVARVVLDVEGAGTRALAMEHGIHRLAHPRHPQQRARVEIVAKGQGRAGEVIRVQPMRRRAGPFGLVVCCRTRQLLAPRGLSIEWLGEKPDVLRQIAGDLGAAWSAAEPGTLEDARLYDGSGARDPRTGAHVSRLKDALRGKLKPLLSAWRGSAPALVQRARWE
jgi:MoxR-like ATPase